MRFLGSAMTAAMLTGTLGQFPVYAAVENGWEEADGKRYWYENSVRQGTYDPGSDAWYWLDNVQQGAKDVMFSLNTAAGSVYYVRSSDFKRELTFSDRPYWADGSFYVPLADIIKGFNMSAEVDWNPDEGYVSIKD